MAIHARPTEQKYVHKGWKSKAAREAEAKGKLSFTALEARGAPAELLAALPRDEWHHIEKGGITVREYYWHENVVRQAAEELQKGRRIAQRH